MASEVIVIELDEAICIAIGAVVNIFKETQKRPPSTRLKHKQKTLSFGTLENTR